MRSNLTMLSFVLVIFFTFDYFALDGRALEWVVRRIQDTGLEWKASVDGVIERQFHRG
jgi:hypothetical protein